VLASTADLNSGFSRELFIDWAPDPKNTIIFTYCTAPGSLARFLIDNPDTKSVEIDVCFIFLAIDSLCYQFSSVIFITWLRTCRFYIADIRYFKNNSNQSC